MEEVGTPCAFTDRGEQGQTFFETGVNPFFVPGTPKNPTRLFYDALGRTVQTAEPNGALTSDRIRTFQTTFQFDVFGRMLSMVYPDGELLEYAYSPIRAK